MLVYAWLQAAQSGDVDPLTALFQLHSILSFVPPVLPTTLLTAFPTPVPTLHSLTHDNGARDALMAASTPICTNKSLDSQVLEHATNLLEVVEQLEWGDVQWIRDMYGPQQGWAADRMWPKIKVIINRHERIYHQLMDPREFNCNKEWFFKFFMAMHSMPAWGRKHKVNQGDSEMVPYRLIEAIQQGHSRG
ncbi:hypothetical protein L208DRAFT_1375277 [Tricholoma matsutake]|nr:hypothetical protein L208DRAFT_1375277 [Tricholoma matsutake 945]